MTVFQTELSRGVFPPAVARDLTEAFHKAEKYLDRLGFRALAGVDRDSVARRIVSEARAGETQPDLVWRAAVAKVLLETRTDNLELDTKCAAITGVPADLPPAGPHAAPQNTNADATPGAAVLSSGSTGDDVDPGAG